jgi:hypothetical protein
MSLGWRRLIGIALNFVVLGTLLGSIISAGAALFGPPVEKAREEEWGFLILFAVLPALGFVVAVGKWLVAGFRNPRL